MTRTLTLRSLDIPQIQKFGIGFDTMFDEIFRNTQQNQTNYPPYNVIKFDEDRYSIEIAVSGFEQGEISIEVHNRLLTVRGNKVEVEGETDTKEYIHRGISSRDFERAFTLADHVEVIGAENRNGILTIALERKVPEDKKPKNVEIKYLT